MAGGICVDAERAADRPRQLATRAIRAALHDTGVLVLSASGEHADVLEAVKADTSGYLLKSASVEELADAVRHDLAQQARCAIRPV